MSHESISLTALGAYPENLSTSVSLATPLTMNRVVGRDRANTVLRELAAAFSVKQPNFVLEDAQRDVVTFAGSVDGDPAELLMILTAGGDGTYRAVDVYARPWPFVSQARQKLLPIDQLFADDIDVSTPYIPDGPTASYLDLRPPELSLAADVAFHSPVMTATASGRDLVGFVLQAVQEVAGEPNYRIFTPTESALFVAYDAHVHGHTWQVAAVFGLNGDAEINDMRIYSRPWPVTAFFRGEIYKLLRDTLGPDFWQGEGPLLSLGEDSTLSTR